MDLRTRDDAALAGRVKALLPRNRLLRVVALPAFEGLPAQAVFVRKYGERWRGPVTPASERRLARIMAEGPDVEVDASAFGVAVTLFVDPTQKALVGMDAKTTVPGMAIDARARRN